MDGRVKPGHDTGGKKDRAVRRGASSAANYFNGTA
jgi:hypothetical protein